ncbi:AAA family ATPase [Candidatus Roizmanbacteria bacterium]|jgi:predicted cytidylate kinase|nr:AAA family ATPase [Candidatus Roizmanbacteria bacterium]
MVYNKITISGKICTGKSTLVKNLRDKLSWKVISIGQYFRDYAKTQRLALDKAEEQNEKLTKKIDYQVRDRMENEANLIVDGWMAGLMAKKIPDVLRILLTCKDDIRYKRFAKRESLTFAEARTRIDERQGSWFAKIKKIYRFDPSKLTDPKNYDLTIDTSYVTPQAILRKVLKTVS